MAILYDYLGRQFPPKISFCDVDKVVKERWLGAVQKELLKETIFKSFLSPVLVDERGNKLSSMKCIPKTKITFRFPE